MKDNHRQEIVRLCFCTLCMMCSFFLYDMKLLLCVCNFSFQDLVTLSAEDILFQHTKLVEQFQHTLCLNQKCWSFALDWAEKRWGQKCYLYFPTHKIRSQVGLCVFTWTQCYKMFRFHSKYVRWNALELLCWSWAENGILKTGFEILILCSTLA
jgi:hypothetical protein